MKYSNGRSSFVVVMATAMLLLGCESPYAINVVAGKDGMASDASTPASGTTAVGPEIGVAVPAAASNTIASGTASSPPPETVVCGAIDNHGGAKSGLGLKGKIFNFESGSSSIKSSLLYESEGVDLGVTLFMNQINVPTRSFDSGFTTEAGDMLKTPQGDVLTEYFGLALDTRLQLTAGDPEGRYQIAIVSDDGSTLRSGAATLLSNEGDHPSQMGCTTRAVTLSRAQNLPLHLNYYQGPRTEIALMMMWRPLAAGDADTADADCGATGITSLTPALSSRGWKIIPAANFLLPTGGGSNPCL